MDRLEKRNADIAGNVHQWREHTIEVRTRALPQFLWLLVRTEVAVDRTKVYTERNVASWRCIVPFEIPERDRVTLGMVESLGIGGGSGMKYRVVVDAETIDEGKVQAEDWYVPYVVLAAFLVGWTIGFLV